MKSILDGRTGLRNEVEKVAEVAGYLWQKGWAERNGGNITVNVTEFVDDEMRNMPAISEVTPIGVTLPHLKELISTVRGQTVVCVIWHVSLWKTGASYAFSMTAQAML